MMERSARWRTIRRSLRRQGDTAAERSTRQLRALAQRARESVVATRDMRKITDVWSKAIGRLSRRSGELLLRRLEIVRADGRRFGPQCRPATLERESLGTA